MSGTVFLNAFSANFISEENPHHTHLEVPQKLLLSKKL
jgi:hypothetical protein